MSATTIQSPPEQQQQMSESNQQDNDDRSELELRETSADDHVQVIVSPKSSMISSRLAEPETAEIMTFKIIEFWKKSDNEIKMAIEKSELQFRKDEWQSITLR